MEIEWIKINKLITGKATEQEKSEIARWANVSKARQKFLKDTIDFYSREEEIDISYRDIQKAWGKVNPKIVVRRKFLRRAASVAASLALIAFSVLSYNRFFDSKDTIPHISPGETKARLVLADGRDFGLDSKTRKLPKNFAIKSAVQGNKTSLVIDVKGRTNERSQEYNEILVPRYAEYQINLEDGTKVWLNSETKLRFPLVFGDKERTVYVSGEAYFQVAHNANKPFIVNIDDNTKVKVLGTEFNIRTYEEGNSLSTLISGSIEFIHKGATRIINPGENCSINNATGEIVVSEADTMRVVAWKNGEFVFRNETLESIINELSRWYKVDVSYENEEIKQTRFYIYFDRSNGFEELIYKLNQTGRIKYRYINKKIVIS